VLCSLSLLDLALLGEVHINIGIEDVAQVPWMPHALDLFWILFDVKDRLSRIVLDLGSPLRHVLMHPCQLLNRLKLHPRVDVQVAS